MMRTMRTSAAFACLLLVAALSVQPVRAADDFFDGDAQTPSPITDRFSLRASFFDAKVETDLRVDDPGIPLSGTAISGARDLGFRPSESDGMVELVFRLRDRNRITAGYLELDQSGTTTLTRPIAFGSQIYNVGDRVSSALQWRVMSLTWTYALIQNDRFELGAGLGVKLTDLDARAQVPARFASYETSRVGALPTPALEAAVRITRRFSLTGHAQYLRVSSNGTSGVVQDFHADAQFRWVPNLAIGAGYSVVRLDVNSITNSNPQLLNIRLRGPEAFVRVSF